MTKTTFFSIVKSFIPGVALVMVLVMAWITFNSLTDRANGSTDNSSAIVSTETKVITEKMIVRKLDKIGEFATLKYDYHGMTTLENSKKLFNLNVPLTKHTIDIMYEGIIKAGIKVKDIRIEIDNENMEIAISLPRVMVLDNYINLDNLICRENNNILNPIQSDEVSDYMVEVSRKELVNATDAGIYKMAEENAKEIILDLLDVYEEQGYEIIFEVNSSGDEETVG